MHDTDGDDVANSSSNAAFADILHRRLTRRGFLKAASAAATFAALPLAGCATAPATRAAVGFQAVPISTDDTVNVAPGYSATALYKWGDPIGHTSGSPAF